MVERDASEFRLLVEAALIWTGWGRTAIPRRDDALLVDRFGCEAACRLLASLKSLEKEFYSSDAWTVAADIQEMGRIAAESFKSKHPEIPDEIVRAFVWCYTYDYK